MPQSVGLCATDISSIAAYANEACERLINDPTAPDEGWIGGWAKMAFTVSRTEPNIYTPQGIARIILLDVCKHPVRINNSWYEFLEFGRGYQPKGCTNANGGSPNPRCETLFAYERETVTTFAPLLATPQYIRAYISDPADVGRTALVQGKDSNGQTVRYLDALTDSSGLGERIAFSSPFTDTSNIWTEITGIQKVKTFGEVQFFQVDATTGAESPLLVMQPGETTASYRKYFIGGLPQQCCTAANPQVSDPQPLQVLAMCKLDFVPVSCDSDYLSIMSIPALKDEAQSIRLGTMDIPGAVQLSQQKHASALRLLFGQLDHYLGKERPALARHLWGSNKMYPQAL